MLFVHLCVSNLISASRWIPATWKTATKVLDTTVAEIAGFPVAGAKDSPVPSVILREPVASVDVVSNRW